MATQTETEIIDLIKQKTTKAKSSGCLPEYELTDSNAPNTRKAIRSIRIAALWSCTTVVVGYLVMIFINIFSSVITSTAMDSSIISGAFVLATMTIISFILSMKTATLAVTPHFALGSLIFALCVNLLFFIGILPLVSVILIIVAFCNYGTYRNWFYGLSRKSRSKKAPDIISKTATTSLPIYVSIIIGAVFLLAGIFIGNVFNFGEEETYDEGYNDGYARAKILYMEDGYVDGYKKGYAAAQNCAAKIANEYDTFGMAFTTMDACYKPNSY